MFPLQRPGQHVQFVSDERSEGRGRERSANRHVRYSSTKIRDIQ